MTNLADALTWTHIPIPAGSAVVDIPLSVGTVGSSEGTTAFITAGVHGDEGPWGAWAIHKMLQSVTLEELQGTVRIVPMANPLAMQANHRNNPVDMLDLNGVFPGDLHGSYTRRLAAEMVRHALDGADVVIDLHGGGPFGVTAYAYQFPGSEALARAFAPPFLVTPPERDIMLSGYAHARGAKVTVVEFGGRCDSEEDWADRLATGLRRALGEVGVLTPLPAPSDSQSPVMVEQPKVLRPPIGGIFVPKVRAGDVGTIVDGGTELGVLLDPVTYEIAETFTAPFPRTALLMLRPTLTPIDGGEMAYFVAKPQQEQLHDTPPINTVLVSM